MLAQGDVIDCTIFLIEKSGAESYAELKGFIRKLFRNQDGNITLAMVHSVKGSEYPRVIGWNMGKFPHPKAEGKLALEQEKNLEYVLYTRAQEELYLVYLGY